MEKKLFIAQQNHHILSLFNQEEQKLFTAKWYLEFGKKISEIFDANDEVYYTVTKKFKFWKWKMTYTIEDSEKNVSILEANNFENTIFKCELNSNTFEIHQHYQQQKSVFKNGTKIAEIQQISNEKDMVKPIEILISKNESIEPVFLFLSALLIGETNQKPVLKSQKTLISNTDIWH